MSKIYTVNISTHTYCEYFTQWISE